MHEYSIVAALVDQVDGIARPRAARVKRVHVRIGELAGVEVPLLETAFDTFKERSVCDGAELVVTRVAAAWACPRCGAPIARGAPLRCAACGAPARLDAGEEIILDRIEMEVA